MPEVHRKVKKSQLLLERFLARVQKLVFFQLGGRDKRLVALVAVVQRLRLLDSPLDHLRLKKQQEIMRRKQQERLRLSVSSRQLFMLAKT